MKKCDICQQKSFKHLTEYVVMFPRRGYIKPLIVKFSVCPNCQKLGQEQVFNLMQYQITKMLRNKK